MAKYIKVYLVRHGETRCNVKKIHQGDRAIRLNDVGKKQAEKASKFFKNVNLDKVYCSPIFRTMQTARIILKHHPSTKLIKHLELRERKIGELAGLTHKQLRKMIPDLEEQWKRDGIDWRPPGRSETLRELFKRSAAAFTKIIKEQKPGSTILIITHGAIIKCILINFKKGKPEEYLKVKDPGNCEIREILWSNGPKRVRCI